MAFFDADGQYNFTTIVEEMSDAKYLAVRQGYFPVEFKLDQELAKDRETKQRVVMEPAPAIRLTVLRPDGQVASGAKLEYLTPVPKRGGAYTTEKPTDTAGQTTLKYPGLGKQIRYKITPRSGTVADARRRFRAGGPLGLVKL